jgi:SEC-C motif
MKDFLELAISNVRYDSGKHLGKVGRNDPCPCGSGKKFKKCHGNPALQNPDPRVVPQWTVRELKPGQVPDAVYAEHLRMLKEDADHLGEFGYTRAPVSGEFKGYRFTALGGQLVYQPAEKARYFTDILLTLIQNVFGKAWWEDQLKLPRDERHPAFQWRFKAMTFMNKQPRTAEGIYVATMTGPMLAYYTFAYDLFVVMDNGRLDERLLERLKRTESFQGARHELFAEATCLRAGFTIEHENEADGSMRHAEFTAIHKETGQRFSVEAKSKHRPGVFGHPGEREPVGEHYLPFHKLLRDAIGKKPPYPLVVFLELNLPAVIGDRLLSMEPPHPLLHKTLDRLRVGEQKLDPISLFVATNHPELYSGDEELTPQRRFLCTVPIRPLHAVQQPAALQYLIHAVQLSSNIPQHFPGATR